MAKPKAAKKKKPAGTGKSKKKPAMSVHLKRGLIGLVVLVLLVLVVGLAVNLALKKSPRARGPVAAIPHVTRHPVYPPAESRPPVMPPATIASSVSPPPVSPAAAIPSPPAFEVFPPAGPTPSPGREKAVRPPITGKRPRVAIIIDDVGYDAQIAERFIGLNATITLSILPYSPHLQQITRMAREKGHDLMLHLPMEPMEFPSVNPGPGALLCAMTPDALIRQLNLDLDDVPFIKGVNNHMGSRMTASSEQMNQIFSSIRKRNLFFIDSRTTSESRARSSARLFQVPYAERDVFLDNVLTPDAIRAQLRQLLQKAAAKGQALAIGHPHAITLQVLQEELPEMQKKVTFVPAASMVHTVG